MSLLHSLTAVSSWYRARGGGFTMKSMAHMRTDNSARLRDSARDRRDGQTAPIKEGDAHISAAGGRWYAQHTQRARHAAWDRARAGHLISISSLALVPVPCLPVLFLALLAAISDTPTAPTNTRAPVGGCTHARVAPAATAAHAPLSFDCISVALLCDHADVHAADVVRQDLPFT